ncbi:MAG: alkaline phosphatase family protein [Prevotellaceae bacterium]|jgi:predicted AlkP superfamily pyrophosphatase or phosphodiesterase|nr:alkaline phosphatase family protein [Prevotellaceae bacterium]
MKKYLTISFFLICALFSNAQKTNQNLDRPKLVVGIVVDQMRWDYLYRFYERYGDDGFKRLLSDGFSCENTMLNYIPTYTAIGHSSIYTGSVPSIHGIAGNDFIRQSTGKWVYCSQDDSAAAVGIPDCKAGKMSPKNLQTTTITDELKLATNFRSKVVGVAIKDRGSILPAGHAADAAYWYNGESGKWITSTFYRNNLPEWLQKFNAQEFPSKKYLKNDWNTLYPLETYVQSADSIKYEKKFNGQKTPFPVKLANLSKKEKNNLIALTPFGNTMTLDVAKLALENEQLGADEITDFLAISLSSTDYIGHDFGINSPKIEDCYLRLDRDLADFLKFLDEKIGEGNYTLFLSADHACAHNAEFLQDHNIPAGIFNDSAILSNLNIYLKNIYQKDSIVSTLNNYQVNFDYKIIKEIPHEELIKNCIEFLEKENSIQYVVEQKNATQSSVPQAVKERIINGYNREFSGEIQIIVKPAYYHDKKTEGCTHGTWNAHDSHIPLLFFGKNIPAGSTNREVYMTDIAPTLAALLKIQMPNGCIGKPIEEIFDDNK